MTTVDIYSLNEIMHNVNDTSTQALVLANVTYHSKASFADDFDEIKVSKCD